MSSICSATFTGYPYCVTYLWTSEAAPGKTITQFNCDTKQHSGPRWLLAGLPGATETATGTVTGTPTESGGGTSTTSEGSAPTVEAGGDNGSSTSNGIHSGEIAGAVMGGVALLGFICLVCWLLRQDRRAISSVKGRHHELPTVEC